MPKQTLEKAILGTSNGSDLWCISFDGWLISTRRTSLNKDFLLTVLSRSFWESYYQSTGKDPVNWETAKADVMDRSSKEFDIENIKGYGAWRNPETGEICYHNGNPKKIRGDQNPKWFLVKRREKEIGLSAPPMPAPIRAKILKTVLSLPFASKREAAGLLSWATASVFCGAFDFRTICMMTGSSGSGKSSIFDHVVDPIIGPAMLAVSATSTEPGIRQKTSIDSRPVVVEELEADSKKSIEVRDAIFALARMSTQNNSPEILKGGKDGESQSFNTRGMFLFMGISPNVTKTADANRMFTCNIVGQKKGESDKLWPENRKVLTELLTPEACNGLRSLTWARLSKIIEVSRDLIELIQDETKLDSRFATKESIILATHIVIWLNMENPSKAQMASVIKQFYKGFEKETRDETTEFIDTILDTVIKVSELAHGEYSFRQLLRMVQSGEYPYDIDTRSVDDNVNIGKEGVNAIKRILLNHGLALVPKTEGAVGFRESDTLMKKIENANRGYKEMIKRHNSMIEKDRTINILGSSDRYVVVGNLL